MNEHAINKQNVYLCLVNEMLNSVLHSFMVPVFWMLKHDAGAW